MPKSRDSTTSPAAQPLDTYNAEWAIFAEEFKPIQALPSTMHVNFEIEDDVGGRHPADASYDIIIDHLQKARLHMAHSKDFVVALFFTLWECLKKFRDFRIALQQRHGVELSHELVQSFVASPTGPTCVNKNLVKAGQRAVWGAVNNKGAARSGDDEIYMSRNLIDAIRRLASASASAQLGLGAQVVQQKLNELLLIFYVTVFQETSNSATKHFFGPELFGSYDSDGAGESGHRLEYALLEASLQAWTPKDTINDQDCLLNISHLVFKKGPQAKVLDTTQIQFMVDSFRRTRIWPVQFDRLQALPASVNLNSHDRLWETPEPAAPMDGGDGGVEAALRESGHEPIETDCLRDVNSAAESSVAPEPNAAVESNVGLGPNTVPPGYRRY
ncbi:hypothetical protein FB45DRAFT_905975 [Roridomyces roridus]|uniref:Uncharacterized protein n=1 Tax=Roridomyces roridus TaxID=1738132 RepID=A0AAD7C5Z4_9AGAR|nr:hypothetical protein FB45DRAFT_905975 [Roridomyces roridus]